MKMNKHKWKQVRRRVRNSSKYNPEKIRKKEKERKQRYTELIIGDVIKK